MKSSKIILVFSLLSFVILNSCEKDKPNTPSKIAPTNLQVTAIPSTDGSGNVAFTATATNAVSFDFEYGNGVIATVPSGVVTFKYTLLGTNTYTVNVTAKSSDGLTIQKSIQVTVNVVNTAGSGLIWSEEFNTDGAPDPAKWGYDLGAGGWGNNELQYYTSRPENVVIINGALKITAKRESFMSSAFTSTRLISKDKFSFKYGKVEVRAKLPIGVGTWPAIWMLGSNINTVSWPGCGEIDIMEHVGKTQNKIYGTLHYPGRSGGNADGANINVSNVSTEFHIYSVEWSASFIKIYADNQLFFTYVNNGSTPFNQNFFMILNVAMGGDFGGPVDAAFSNSSMEIDYVRVYQ